MRSSIGASLVAAALAVMMVPSSASAQVRPSPDTGSAPMPRVVPHPRGERAGMASIGMDPLAHLPLLLLEQREALGLDSAQIQKLEALHVAGARSDRAHRGSLAAIHDRLAAAMSGDHLDLDAYRDAVRAEADSMVARRMEVAGRAQRALGLLTAAQRSNALYGIRLLHVMHGGGMGAFGGGAMPAGPGDQRHRGPTSGRIR